MSKTFSAQDRGASLEGALGTPTWVWLGPGFLSAPGWNIYRKWVKVTGNQSLGSRPAAWKKSWGTGTGSFVCRLFTTLCMFYALTLWISCLIATLLSPYLCGLIVLRAICIYIIGSVIVVYVIIHLGTWRSAVGDMMFVLLQNWYKLGVGLGFGTYISILIYYRFETAIRMFWECCKITSIVSFT